MENGESKIRKIFISEVSIAVFIATTVLGGFIYLTRPQSEAYTALQLQDQRISSMQKIIDELTKTQQNDTKELKNEVAGLRLEIQQSTVEIAKLTTVINERIPKAQPK